MISWAYKYLSSLLSYNAYPIPAVQIAEPETDQVSTEDTLPKRQFSAGLAKRLSGRPAIPDFGSSRSSMLSQNSLEALSSHTSTPNNQQDSSRPHTHHHHHSNHLDKFVAQVAEWVEHERVKKQNRRSRRVHSSRRKTVKDDADKADSPPQLSPTQPERKRSHSIDSQSSDVSLDRLQKIIDDSMSALGLHGIPHYSMRLRKKSPRRRSVTLHRTASSDTEYHDGDVRVPACDAVLDNSKTLGYSGGKPGSTDDGASMSSKKEEKERKGWITFKNEIIKLSHTLRLKGWRRVPLDRGDSIDVTRLSGALTNAVYVVSPPEDIVTRGESGNLTPPKLLLRIYGPQVEHIIDRENELSVLRRLARKKIGPRLLGTFTNGRFEQYLNAEALTAADLRDPDTSKKIAKRMRELHDGIELLDYEKDGGPKVLVNWDSWLDRVSRAVMFLDKKILSGDVGPIRGPADAWKQGGLICGVEWPFFKEVVDRYRKFLDDYYRSPNTIRDRLVFAHSDAQYGNILRVRPDDKKSPLLQPNYEHKQLVVIDFEYSAANTRGLEFANHFTEWCYNYHDENASFACNTSLYPTLEEQRRFIRAYVHHRPEFPHPGASTPNITPLATPVLQPSTPALTATISNSSLGPTSSIKEFMLDSRAPPGGWKEEERRAAEVIDAQVEALIEETRIWRVANSAQWIAWGVMQATIPGFDDDVGGEKAKDGSKNAAAEGSSSGGGGGVQDEEDAEASEFDYLGYARERALFFLGDCVKMGVLKIDELPEDVRGRLKYVVYE
ncbi:kinase-like protein [Hypoxylon fragiforme]|uniref:kinase-like protein n=1 Tax=Hypoxylon fragiforme TaxID=63214 RepID=UPI0020C728A3|nr:kinase-like protein [Hypoxylon fragiforme]KAI2605203.1 kinase-like protein [Hypoxylon fragiforme]